MQGRGANGLGIKTVGLLKTNSKMGMKKSEVACWGIYPPKRDMSPYTRFNYQLK